MNLTELKELRHEADLCIKGAESWAPEFKKNRKLFKRLTSVQSALESEVKAYFEHLARRVHTFVNWHDYAKELARRPTIKAAELTYNVGISFDESDAEAEGAYLTAKITEPMIEAVALGALYAESDTGMNLGASTAVDWVQKAATGRVGELVSGITDTTRNRIEQSIETSLTMGESILEATHRLSDVIDDPYRAEMIARTETVTSWGSGITAFGKEAGATGKVWHTSGNPCPICQDNEADGEIAFDDSFSSGDDTVPAHPNCQCFITLVLANGEEEAG